MTHPSEKITLLIPVWQGRKFRLHLPPDVAAFLRDQLDDALGEPRQKPRRPVKLRRGKWQK